MAQHYLSNNYVQYNIILLTIHRPCKSKGGGGVGIYIDNIYTIIERPDLSIFIEGRFESIFLEI